MTVVTSPEGSEEWVLIEKQDTYQQDRDWKAEEKDRVLASPTPLLSDSSWERKKGSEKEIDVAKMIHIEVTGDDGQEMKTCIDEFSPAKSPTREANECPEPRLSNNSRFVVELAETADSPESDALRKSSGALENYMAPEPDRHKDQQPSRRRKKKRPESLNLGMSTEFIYEKEGEGSEGEESEGSHGEESSSDKTDGPISHPGMSLAEAGPGELSPLIADDQRSTKARQKSGPVHEDEGREGSPLVEEGGDTSPQKIHRIRTDAERNQTQSPVSEAQSAVPGLSPVNGPGKAERDTPPEQVREESGVKSQVRERTVLDNVDYTGVKLRQVRSHERKASSSGGEDIEGLISDKVQRRSFHRLSGQSEITRIVPLKPERSKSVACKDETDRGPYETESGSFKERILKREYRWSVGSPDGSDWSDTPTFPPAFNSASSGRQALSPTSTHREILLQHPGERGLVDPEGLLEGEKTDDSAHSQSKPACDDTFLPARGAAAECHLFGSKVLALPKTAPPAPPVKTQKARESGLILRNSRSGSREPGPDAAKKRHSEPLSTPAIYEVPLADIKRELWERRPRPGSASEEDQERDTVLCMKETHLGIERKCSSMTVSSTSSLEAEVDFTVLMDLHSGVEEFSKGMSELGGGPEPEIGSDDFEETSRFYSARLMGSYDKTPLEEKAPEERVHHEPPVARKDPSAVSVAHMLRKADARPETHTNGSEVISSNMDSSQQQMEDDVTCLETIVSRTAVAQPPEGDMGVVNRKETTSASRENGSPVKPCPLGRESLVSPLTVTAENVTSATTTQVTKTVKGGYSETRIEKRIIITGDDDVDQHQALAMAIQEAKQQHPDMLVTKAVVVRETESPTKDDQRKLES